MSKLLDDLLNSISQETKDEVNRQMDWIEKNKFDIGLSMLPKEHWNLTEKDWLSKEQFYKEVTNAIWNEDEMSIQWALAMRIYLNTILNVDNLNFEDLYNKIKDSYETEIHLV